MAAKLNKAFFLWATAFVAALLFLVFTIQTIRDAVRAGDWPVVEGQIVSSQYFVGCGNIRRNYFPDVNYEYIHDGKRYRGNQVVIDTDFCGGSFQASAIANSFKPGQRVAVRVDPAHPNRSVLQAGKPQLQSIVLLITALAGSLYLGYNVISKLFGSR